MTKDKVQWAFNLLLLAVVLGFYFGSRFIDCIQWDSANIPEDAYWGTGSPTFGTFIALLFLFAVSIHSLNRAKNSNALAPGEMTKRYLKSDAGALGISMFLAFLLIAKADPYLANLISSEEHSLERVEVSIEHGQPHLDSADDIRDLISPSYFAYVQKGAERNKVGICKPLRDALKTGRTTVTILRSKSFGAPMINVKCD